MRTDRRRTRRIAIILAAGLPLMVLALMPQRPWLLYNHTPSVPVGFYLYAGGCIERGDLVAFPLPEAAHGYAQRRGDSRDVLLLKPVLAMGGDHVSTLHGELRINGVFVGTIPEADSAGRSLPRWRAARPLQRGELFVGSTRSTHSFDSRFFGPIHASQVVGVYRSLWTRSPGEAPSAMGASPATSPSGSRRRSRSAGTRH